jgi:hypothetical protein
VDKRKLKKSRLHALPSVRKFGFEQFRMEAVNGMLSIHSLEFLRETLGIPSNDYVSFLEGADNLDQQTIEALEQEYKAIKQGLQIQESKSPRGGLRARAGRKGEGNISKLIRVTGSPDEMKLVIRWMSQAPRASRRLVALILRDMDSQNLTANTLKRQIIKK